MFKITSPPRCQSRHFPCSCSFANCKRPLHRRRRNNRISISSSSSSLTTHGDDNDATTCLMTSRAAVCANYCAVVRVVACRRSVGQSVGDGDGDGGGDGVPLQFRTRRSVIQNARHHRSERQRPALIALSKSNEQQTAAAVAVVTAHKPRRSVERKR